MRETLMMVVALLVGLLLGALFQYVFRRREVDSSLEQFKNRAAGIQSFTVAFAIFVGGFWTFYTFVVRDVLQLFDEAQINIEVVAQEVTPASCKFCATATVKITNTGKRNVFLDHRSHRSQLQTNSEDPIPDKDSLRIKEAVDGSVAGSVIATTLSAYRVLRTGETVQYSFLVGVPQPGMYAITFEVPLPAPELAIHNRVAEQVGAPQSKSGIVWTGSTMLNVTGQSVIVAKP